MSDQGVPPHPMLVAMTGKHGERLHNRVNPQPSRYGTDSASGNPSTSNGSATAESNSAPGTWFAPGCDAAAIKALEASELSPGEASQLHSYISSLRVGRQHRIGGNVRHLEMGEIVPADITTLLMQRARLIATDPSGLKEFAQMSKWHKAQGIASKIWSKVPRSSTAPRDDSADGKTYRYDEWQNRLQIKSLLSSIDAHEARYQQQVRECTLRHEEEQDILTARLAHLVEKDFARRRATFSTGSGAGPSRSEGHGFDNESDDDSDHDKPVDYRVGRASQCPRYT